jgi:hypothetical protein
MDPDWLPNDFKELLQVLNANRVEYLLIGGWAVMYYGHPRYTADIDFWCRRDAANAARLIRALQEFGISDPDLTTDLVLEPGRILRMGRAPLRVEFLNQIDGVEFDACYKARVMEEIDRIEIPLISLPDLLVNKRASNRAKDLADIEGLTK